MSSDDFKESALRMLELNFPKPYFSINFDKEKGCVKKEIPLTAEEMVEGSENGNTKKIWEYNDVLILRAHEGICSGKILLRIAITPQGAIDFLCVMPEGGNRTQNLPPNARYNPVQVLLEFIGILLKPKTV